MIHTFPLPLDSNGGFAVVDVNSGAVHAVDKLAHDVLAAYDGGGAARLPHILQTLGDAYSADEITEAFNEVLALQEQGLLYAPEDTPPETDADASAPVIKALCLLVAQDCNLRCSYCFAGDGEYGERGLMTPETAKQAVDFLIASSRNRRNLEIDFFGGEPLMNFGVVKEAVAYARSLETALGKRFRFTITTNGTLLDDESIAFINNNMQNVVLSLDGRQSVNDAMRGEGVYDAAVPKLKQLLQARQAHPVNRQCYIRGTFTRRNPDFAEDAAHLASLGFPDVSVEPVVAPDSADYALREEHLPAILSEYERLAHLIRPDQPGAFNFFHFMIDLEGGPCAIKRASGCGAGTQYAAVTADGSLYPCHQFASLPDKERFCMGDVRSGITNAAAVKDFQHSSLHDKPACSDCFAKYYCGGGCAANAYAATGDIRGVYKLGCTMQRKRTELAIGLKLVN